MIRLTRYLSFSQPLRRSLLGPRWLCSAASGGQDLTPGEQMLISVLKEKFPGATEVQVQDISGGCGSMYEIMIEASEFQGKRLVMQHRMVNEALAEQIKEMHGLRISTKVPAT